jgi:hypothetical protein
VKVQTLAGQLLFSTVRIEASGPDKGSIGTGFVFDYEFDTDEDKSTPFMVTNKHVIEDAEEGSFVFIENDGNQNPLLGWGIKVPFIRFKEIWHGHPDPDVDIAVSPMRSLIDLRVEAGDPATIGERTFVAPIRSSHIPTLSKIEQNYDAIEEVLFIGYPDGLYDEENLTPIVRRGITATPLQIDYEGKPTFLIDASVFPGSSGSPVFAGTSAVRADGNANLVLVASRLAFLGVIAKCLEIKETGQVEWKPIPTGKKNKKVPTYTTSQALNLGIVYKSHTVLETVEDYLQKYGASQRP